MEQVIQLASQMNWPFAIAVVGLGIAVTVPMVVSIVSRSARRQAEIERKKSVELRNIDVSVKNALVPSARND